MIEIDGLYKYLTQDAAISALVNTRVYMDSEMAKGATLPLVVCFQTHGESFESLDGDNPTELKRFQFSCFARNNLSALTLRRAIRSRLVPKSDGSGSTPTVSYDLPDGTHIQSARLHDERDLPAEEGTGESIRHSMIEVEFVYENPS